MSIETPRIAGSVTVRLINDLSGTYVASRTVSLNSYGWKRVAIPAIGYPGYFQQIEIVLLGDRAVQDEPDRDPRDTVAAASGGSPVSVPVRGTIRPNRHGTFTEKHAAEIGERLIALEKAVGGATGGATFVSPAVPAFGGGAGGAPGAPSAPCVPGAPGASDHGVLTGLADDDHPQYAKDGYPARPLPHQHPLSDVPDFNLWEMMLWRRVFGG